MADDLAVRSESVASRLEENDPCGAQSEAMRLQADTIAAVNDRKVPRRYQEELLGSVNALVESIDCAPPAPAVEEEAPEDDEEREEDERNEEVDDSEDDDKPAKDNGKGNGKGKGAKKGKGNG